MNYSKEFWRQKILFDFVPMPRLVVNIFVKKLIPSLDGMEAEIDQEAENSLCELNAGGAGVFLGNEPFFIDSMAEHRADALLRLCGIRQGVVNLAALSLFHEFEQNVMLFLKEQLFSVDERVQGKKLDFDEFIKKASKYGIEVENFSSWADIKELRLLANVIKHAEGRSSRELAEIAPALFGLSSEDRAKEGFAQVAGRIHWPLFGLDLFVKEGDLHRYADAIGYFWNSLIHSFETASISAAEA